MITHLEPDILECEVKWAVGHIITNKGSGVNGIPDELFQILKDDAVKVLHSICQQIWKTQQWPQEWERSVFILIQKRGSANECSKYCTVALFSHDSKAQNSPSDSSVVCEQELPDVEAGFRKRRGTRDQIDIGWITEKEESSQETSGTSALLTTPKP